MREGSGGHLQAKAVRERVALVDECERALPIGTALQQAGYEVVCEADNPDGVDFVVRLSPTRPRSGILQMAPKEELDALLHTQKMEAVAQLACGVAHDFNNILAAIMGSFSLIRRRTDSATVLTQVERGEQAADKAAALVKQLLTFARKQQLRPQVLDVEAVVTGTDTLIAHTIGRNVSRSVNIPPGIWSVLADPQQMEVALLNLAVNSRDAMPDGGVMTVTARNLPANERPRHLPMRDYVAIGVRDTGHGMPPDVAARATEPFFTTK